MTKYFDFSITLCLHKDMTKDRGKIAKRFLQSLLIGTTLCIWSPTVIAQPRPPGYADAEIAYRKLPTADRVYVQTLLTAAGYWNGVPNIEFNGRIFDSINNFISLLEVARGI
jgi:hypothetical protein